MAPVPISEGTEQGPSVSAETVGWAPQFWYQVLGKKTKQKKKLLGLALFQSRSRLTSFNKTITIACVVFFFFYCPPGAKTVFYSTLDLNQGTWHEKGVEINQEEARPRQRSSRDLCHTPRLHSYLPVWRYKTDTVPLFFFFFFF